MENKKSNILINYIKNEIHLGNLVNGDKIKPERVLATELGIGRTSVREGLKVLEIIGLIRSERGGGTYITANFNNMLVNPLSLAFELQSGNIEDVIEIRKMLEISHAPSLIKNITLGELKKLEDIYNEMISIDDTQRLDSLDKQFHFIMMSSSSNALLITLIHSISELLKHSISMSRKKVLLVYGKEKIDEDHKNILGALKEKNVEKLEKSLKIHFSYIEKSLKN